MSCADIIDFYGEQRAADQNCLLLAVVIHRDVFVMLKWSKKKKMKQSLQAKRLLDNLKRNSASHRLKRDLYSAKERRERTSFFLQGRKFKQNSE